jgi:hypothetical protein
VPSEKLLPKRVVDYIHEMGVRALDRLADSAPVPAAAGDAASSVAAPTAIQTLIDQWKAMATGDKEEFVERVAGAVVEVIAASAALPTGRKSGKKAARATKKVLKRETRKVRKAAKVSVSSKPDKKAKAKDDADGKAKVKKQTAVVDTGGPVTARKKKKG